MSSFFSRKGVLLALVGLCFHAPIQAQEASQPVRAFLSAGGGFGTHHTLYASASLSHHTGDYIVRGALAYNLFLGVFGIPGSFEDDGEWRKELAEGALLYGRRARASRGWARGALGVGYVSGEQLDPVSPGEEPTTSAFGLAAQAWVAWTPQPWLGLGLTGVGNLNNYRSLGALTLSVHLGRTR